MSSTKSILRRVKLYHLNSEGKWEDKGTGHVICEKKDNKASLIMTCEKEDLVLLSHTISMEDIYQLQNESLIVWSDKELKIEMALSFQSSDGCQQVWDEMRVLQGKKPDSKEIIAKEKEEKSDDSPNVNYINLPNIEVQTLPTIIDLMLYQSKESVANTLLDNEHILLEKLFQLFKECEENKDIKSLSLLFEIFKTIILLDDTRLYDLLFSEKYVYQLLGVLEYDPDLPKSIGKANHREYLKKIVVYKEVIPFTNSLIYKKIHQTFKIQYIKDSILPRNLDDSTCQTLNTIVMLNNQEITQMICNDEEFLKNLFKILLSDSPKRVDGIKLLQEYINILKSIQMYTRTEAYRVLIKHKFFEALEHLIIDQELEVRKSCANIIHLCVSHDTSLLKRYVLSQDIKCNFLNNMILSIIGQNDTGVQEQLVDTLEIFLEPENLGEKKDEILNIFYENHIQNLLKPLQESCKFSSEIYICELLSFFVKSHGYRIRNFILKNNILGQVLKLASHNEKHIALASIRFFKSFIITGEIFYQNHIIQNDLFDPVIKLWKLNEFKYNLIHSAIVDIFEHLKSDSMKKLLSHINEKYENLLSNLKIGASKRKMDENESEKKKEQEYFEKAEEENDKFDQSDITIEYQAPLLKKRKTEEDEE